jgi:hypothetical protein
MAAATMSLELHDCGIHAVEPSPATAPWLAGKSGCLRPARRAVIGDDTAEPEGGVMRREHEAVTARL